MKNDQPLTRDYIMALDVRRMFEEANLLRTFADAARIFEIAYESRGKFSNQTLFLAMQAAFDFMFETGPEIFRKMFEAGLPSMLKAFLRQDSRYCELGALGYSPNQILEILLGNPESGFLLKLGTVVGYPPSRLFLQDGDCYDELARYCREEGQLRPKRNVVSRGFASITRCYLRKRPRNSMCRKSRQDDPWQASL